MAAGIAGALAGPGGKVTMIEAGDS